MKVAIVERKLLGGACVTPTKNLAASAHTTHLTRRAAEFGVVLGSDVGGAPLHAAVAAVFFDFGVGVGLWGGASGAILTRAGVDRAAFGTILTVYTGAYLVAMSACGALAHRFGVERSLAFSAILFGALLCALLNAGSAAWVAIDLVAAGFLGGLVDVTMNSEGARIERRLGRRSLQGCMPQRRRAWRSARFSAA